MEVTHSHLTHRTWILGSVDYVYFIEVWNSLGWWDIWSIAKWTSFLSGIYQPREGGPGWLFEKNVLKICQQISNLLMKYPILEFYLGWGVKHHCIWFRALRLVSHRPAWSLSATWTRATCLSLNLCFSICRLEVILGFLAWIKWSNVCKGLSTACGMWLVLNKLYFYQFLKNFELGPAKILRKYSWKCCKWDQCQERNGVIN